MTQTIDFDSLYSPIFRPIHDDLWSGHEYTEYWLKGGRGSGKSSFAGFEIVAGMLADKDANAIIYRRVGNTIKDSVYSQLVWAIDMLGVSEYFRFRTSPLEIQMPRTRQRIMFRGADDPMKSKSIKLEKGYFKFLWFEELSEFRGMEDIRTIKQSVFRGSNNRSYTFYSYNPPKTAQAWVNGEALKREPKRLVHTSTYLDVPESWLGEQFVDMAETLKQTNPLAYRNEYLGEVTGTGGNVFENVKLRPITDDEINQYSYFYQGIDWGYFPDPFAWVRTAFDVRQRRLIIIDEYRANKLGNKEAYNAIKDRLRGDEYLTADSAEPKSIADFRDYGATWIRGVVKGAGSVDYTMKWLGALREIVIDPERCPNTAKEFTEYEYERNANGEFISGYVDANNHFIDATRYALYPVWKRKGE